MKEKRFHTPLSMAVPQTGLRYAMGAKCERKALSHSIIYGSTADKSAVCNGSKSERKYYFERMPLTDSFTHFYLWQYRRHACDMQWV